MRSQIPGQADFPANPVDKSGYRLEFCDQFENATLDADRWLPFYLPQWSRKHLTQARYSLPGDRLSLHIEAEQPAWCPEYDGAIRVSSLQTGCFSGPVGSGIGQHKFHPDLTVVEAQPAIKNYTPQYGYFETRLKAIPAPGYMVALWMIGFEEQAVESGEICVCEIFGRAVTVEVSEVGYGVHPFNDPKLVDEFYQEKMPLNAANYHIYAAEWTPTHIDFYVDNQHQRRILQSPSYPMQFMLGVYELPDQLEPDDQAAEWPKTFEVDYVRGYQPLAGYEQGA